MLKMSLIRNLADNNEAAALKLITAIRTLAGLGMLNLAIAGPAQGALIDRGNGLIYDSSLDITWLADANYASTSGYDLDGKMNWTDANTWAGQLSYGGFDDWRLPYNPNLDSSCDNSRNVGGVAIDFGFGCTGSEYGHLFYVDLGGQVITGLDINDPELSLFTNVRDGSDPLDEYWASEISGVSYIAHHFHFGDGYQRYYDTTVEMYAMAVRDGDVSAVPVPAAIWLFATGLLGLVSIGYQRK